MLQNYTTLSNRENSRIDFQWMTIVVRGKQRDPESLK